MRLIMDFRFWKKFNPARTVDGGGGIVYGSRKRRRRNSRGILNEVSRNDSNQTNMRWALTCITRTCSLHDVYVTARSPLPIRGNNSDFFLIYQDD